jgi:hypothetical protein
LWVVAVLAILAADLSLYITAQTVTGAVPWMDLSGIRLSPDSLRKTLSRFLHDSIGVATERRNDTSLITVPPGARRLLDDRFASLSGEARQASMWLIIGLLLFHVPLLLALVAFMGALIARAREERNLALDEWRDEAEP